VAKTVSVRLSEKRYKELRKLSLRFGQPIAWYLNKAVDMLLMQIFAEEVVNAETKSQPPIPAGR